MARSQGTFSKKEKEKKRLQKRKEKEERKQERKSTAVKGQALEDMMAYVDENGNISDTPPDPKKKREYDQESIQIGVEKQKPADPKDLIRKGKVTFFNQAKAFGFIKDDETQESVFVHANALIDPIKDNDKVQFEVENTSRGTNALRVKKI
ncbi:MAG TPA: cold shock domain-containing protein [Bacteroidia bacterium]|jgi:cold shock CspA family protein|nr:cold shock domain-containing protein [Bacteroidia bacterium]